MRETKIEREKRKVFTIEVGWHEGRRGRQENHLGNWWQKMNNGEEMDVAQLNDKKLTINKFCLCIM